MTTNQSHSGIGDNVAGDKTVNKYYSASDENLTDIAEELIYKISVQDSEKALEQIQTYQKFSGLPSEAVNLFNILTNFIEYFNSTDKQFDTQAIIRALRNTQCSKLKELYQSLHVRVIFNEKGEKQARSLYKSYSDEANYYLMAVYDHLLASSDELDERYNNLHILDDYLLLNLANGLWRFDSFEKAIHVIDHISNNGKNDYIECLRIASKYNSIVKVPNLQSYPYLPRDTARKLKQQIDGFLEIISFKNTLSSFELNLLIAMTNGFLPYLYGLREQAIRFKDEITKKDPDLGQWLEKIYSQTIPDLSKEIIDKLHSGQDLNHHELSDCLTALKHKKLNVQVMEGWLKTSGIIIDTDTTFMQFLKVFILSFKNYKDVKEALDYKKLLNNFIEKNGDSLRTIPAVYLMALIDNLFSIDGRFHISIYNILEKVSKDIAVDNELYFYYLKSLLQLNKLKTLQKEFDKIDESEWTHPLYSLYARYLLEISEYQQAIGTYQKFIDDTNNLYFWHQYLFCCLKNDDIDVAQRELKRIPKRLFSTHTVGFDFFIIQIGNFVDTPFIQKLLVSLFVKNPDDYARIFTQFFLSLIGWPRPHPPSGTPAGFPRSLHREQQEGQRPVLPGLPVRHHRCPSEVPEDGMVRGRPGPARRLRRPRLAPGCSRHPAHPRAPAARACPDRRSAAGAAHRRVLLEVTGSSHGSVPHRPSPDGGRGAGPRRTVTWIRPHRHTVCLLTSNSGRHRRRSSTNAHLKASGAPRGVHRLLPLPVHHRAAGARLRLHPR